MSAPVLEISDLRVDLGDAARPTHVLRGVDLDLPRGATMGLVGESGSGKSTTMLAAVGLLPASTRILSGSIRLEGRELLALRERDWRSVRGGIVASMFQNAANALHPMRTIGDQVARAYRTHCGGGRAASRREAAAALAEAGLPDATTLAHRYPHQLSGGQCQRAMIAMALVTRPHVVLADEPTSGLDVTVQQQVLDTLVDRVREHGMTMLLISHDVGVIRSRCDSVAVMYAGEVIERGTREAVLDHPAHPYTEALLEALDVSGRRMQYIPGTVPDLREEIAGCPFAGRCPHTMNECYEGRPAPYVVDGEGHSARCILHAPSAAEGTPAC